MTISEVSKKFGLSADTLRYYERSGLIPKVGRTAGGIRNYSESDCGWIDFIKCMRSAGVQVAALTRYVSLFRQGDSTSEERKEILIRERNRIANEVNELEATLERLNQKIISYEKSIIPAERKLALEP